MFFLTSAQVLSHEMTPTYPELRPSYTDGLYSVKMKLFNRRDDIEYYQVNVYDQEWNPVAFAIGQRIIRLPYLERTNFTLYVRNEDKERVKYICTKSKILKDDLQSAVVASRICSKIK